MAMTWWDQAAAWWVTVTPEFCFLLALPFLVAAAGLLRDWFDKCVGGSN